MYNTYLMASCVGNQTLTSGIDKRNHCYKSMEHDIQQTCTVNN